MADVEPIARQLSKSSRGPSSLTTSLKLGVLGLLEAEASFVGPAQNFDRHARSAILAAIAHEIATLDLPSPSLVRTMRRNSEDSERLAQTLGRSPTPGELAAASGMTISAYQGAARDFHIRRTRRIVQIGVLRQDLQVAEMADPLHAALRLSEKRSLRLALAGLPKRDKKMLYMHYRDNLKLKEIGALFGVSESRVCQVMSKALSRLRQSISSC